MKEILLWVDVETTGLDPDKDFLLELAAIPTTFDTKLEYLGKPFNVVIRTPEVSLSRVTPYVLAMHSENGLWDDCAGNFSVGRFFANRRFGNALTEWDLLGEDKIVYLAGRSVHFDRSWIEQLGQVDSDEWFEHLNLSHRHFDLSSVKMYSRLRGEDIRDGDDGRHRALSDVENDIILAREFLNR